MLWKDNLRPYDVRSFDRRTRPSRSSAQCRQQCPFARAWSKAELSQWEYGAKAAEKRMGANLSSLEPERILFAVTAFDIVPPRLRQQHYSFGLKGQPLAVIRKR